MPRRRSNGLSPITLLLIALPLIGVAFIGWKMSRGREATLEGVPELKTRDYFENANSLRGNTYQVTGTVEDSLRWVAGKGRLISVTVKNADGTAGDPLPIRIPPHITENIQTGQSFVFKVTVGEGGLLIADSLHKN
jgi:hypothetical protein